jgi:hypothetical protein
VRAVGYQASVLYQPLFSQLGELYRWTNPTNKPRVIAIEANGAFQVVQIDCIVPFFVPPDPGPTGRRPPWPEVLCI